MKGIIEVKREDWDRIIQKLKKIEERLENLSLSMRES